MRRFLALLAIATVAGVMYVAAAPGSGSSRGPTLRQFYAMKLQLATLTTRVKTLQGQVKTQASKSATDATSITALNGQVTALNSNLSALKTDETGVKTLANADSAFINGCFLSPSAGVAGSTERGDLMGQTSGFAFYNYPPGSSPSFYTGALGLDFSSTPQFFLQTVDPDCVSSSIGPATHHPRSASSHQLLERTR
jgi:hypothetical protein